MLQNAYFLAKIGADTAENEQHFAEMLPKICNRGATSSRKSGGTRLSRSPRVSDLQQIPVRTFAAGCWQDSVGPLSSQSAVFNTLARPHSPPSPPFKKREQRTQRERENQFCNSRMHARTRTSRNWNYATACVFSRRFACWSFSSQGSSSHLCSTPGGPETNLAVLDK